MPNAPDTRDPLAPVLELVGFVLVHALNSIARGGPLIPFVVTQTRNGRDLRRFVADTLEEGKEQAKSFFAKATVGAEQLAMAYDGYLTLDGGRAAALIVEAWGRGMDAPVVFGQRYRPGSRLRKLRK